MVKRKSREDPDSSGDEDVARADFAPARKASKRKNEKTALKSDDKDTAMGPFEDHARPSEAETRAARDGLARLHGEPTRPDFVSDSTGKSKKTILDSLVQTILSQNTTDSNSHRTFANLKADFKDWEEVRTAPSAKVEASIKLGGLAAIKTERIKAILDSTIADQGECSLEHLRSKPDEEIKTELLKYNGVGPKTAACVLMFAMGRFEFPVDTHVWRITKNLGWVPKNASREETYEHLNTRIPDDIKYDLHVLLVEHGKRCVRCSKNGHPRKEQHGPCPLTNLAAAAKAGHKLSGKEAAQDAEESLKNLDGNSDNGAEEGEETEDVKEEEDIKEEADVKPGPIKVEAGIQDAEVKEEPDIKEEQDVKVKDEPASPPRTRGRGQGKSKH